MLANETVMPYTLNRIRSKKIKDKHLVTISSGSYVALSEMEYVQLIQNNFSEELFKKLENKGIVITQNNENRIIDEYRKKNAFIAQGTSLHIVVITLRCNQVCTYCHASTKPMNMKEYDMTKETAKKTVDFIFQSPSHEIAIEFQGGDSLINFPILKYMTEYAYQKNKIHKKDLRLTMVSNLTLLTDEILDFLVKNKIGICTSLDGPKEVHDKIRKYRKSESETPGTYDDVVKSLNKIRQKDSNDPDYKSIPNALLVVTKHSLGKYKEIIDEYVKQGFDSIFFRNLSKLGFANNSWEDLSYETEEFLEFYKKGIEYIVKNKLPIREVLTTIILKKILTKHDPGYTDLRSPCGAFIGQAAYNYDGLIYTCDEGRMIGEVFGVGTVDQTYKEVLTSDQTCSVVKASVNDNYMCNTCAYKPYCGVCPACNYASKGNIVPKPLANDSRCKMYMGIFNFIFEKLLYDEEYKEVFLSWAHGAEIFDTGCLN